MHELDSDKADSIREKGLESTHYNYADHHSSQRCHVHRGILRGRSSRALQLNLSLLRACRQINLEAALLPYTWNIFSFADAQDFERFVDQLMTAQQRAIRSITIGISVECFYLQRPSAVSKLKQLNEVTIFGQL